MTKYLFYFIIGLFLLSCSAERDTMISKAYHNTTAHYNPYFIVNQDHEKERQDLFASIDDKYYDVLILYPEFDTTAIISHKEMLENDVKLCSKTVDWHKNSKWVGPGYIQLGNTFFYLRSFEKSITALKLAYKKASDEAVKNEALIRLMHTYLDALEIKNALEVRDILRNKELNEENQKGFYFIQAVHAQREEDFRSMYNFLNKMVPLLKKRDKPARIYYTMAQLAELNKDLELAAKYYKKCQKSNPTYLMSFNSKLRYISVLQVSDEKGISKMRTYFKKLLRDPKNAEYRDKVYYEWALFELNKKGVQETLSLLRDAAKEQSSSPMQKALIYYKASNLYFDSLSNIVKSSAYLDSTMQFLPQKVKYYKETKKKQEILARFVEHYQEKHLQDSLLMLAELPKAELDKIIDDKIAAVKAKQEKEEKERQKKKKASYGGSSFDPERDNAFANGSFEEEDSDKSNQKVSSFYFYNLAAKAKGEQEFKRRWGGRVLSDDWRRSAVQIEKASNRTLAVQNVDSLAQISAELTKKDKSKLEEDLDRTKYTKTIPFEESQKQVARLKVDKALFEMGKIYHYELSQDQNAIKMFSELVKRFEKSENRPEAMYLLFLMYQKYDKNAANAIKAKLTSQYPNSLFANLAINPNYREDKALENEEIEKLYAEAYKYYERGQYRVTDSLITEAMIAYPETNFNDNFDLLRILLLPKIAEKEDFKAALEAFPEKWPDSELIPYSKTLLAQIDLFDAEESKKLAGVYKRNFDAPHLFIINFSKEQVPIDSVYTRATYFVDSTYEQGQGLTVIKKTLDSRYQQVIIQEFPTKEDAMDFYRVNIGEKDPFKAYDLYEFDRFVITKENFDILQDTKEIIDYLDFFDEYYQKNNL